MYKSMTNIASIGFICMATAVSHAGLTFSNASIGQNSISFEISGTIDGPAPFEGSEWLFFVDPTRADGWISSFQTATITSNISVNGNPNEIDNLWVEQTFGFGSSDRITMNRFSGFSAGDVLAGTFTASWTSPIDLTGFGGNLDVYWGRDANGDEMNGTYQGTFSIIPAPGTLALLGFGGFVGARRRR